jgi:hypothetical protein
MREPYLGRTKALLWEAVVRKNSAQPASGRWASGFRACDPGRS